MSYWLVKQEPGSYSFDDLVQDGKTDWTGVRNFQARNNLRAMKTGDRVLFYHSGSEKAVVGEAKVSREEFPDPTDEKWVAVELAPVQKLKRPISLEQIKSQPDLANCGLLRQSRLSVVLLSEDEFMSILNLSDLKS